MEIDGGTHHNNHYHPTAAPEAGPGGPFRPLVSIVIPVYNGANYVREAIDSALAQDYPPFEVVVVNDGSTDGTDAIVRSYGDRLRYVAQENGGVATALNAALDHARGDYISWLSHDDLYDPDKLSTQVAALARLRDAGGDIDRLIPCGPSRIREEESGALRETSARRPDLVDYARLPHSLADSLTLLYADPPHGCTFLIPRRAFDECGRFSAAWPLANDIEMWFRLLAGGYRFLYVDRLSFTCRKHATQDSRTRKRRCREERDGLSAFCEAAFLRPEGQSGLSAAQRAFIDRCIASTRRKVAPVSWPRRVLDQLWRLVPVPAWRRAWRRRIGRS